MKYERLVEMAKAIGRQNLIDRDHAKRYKRSLNQRRRYEPARHLAQEGDDQIDKKPNKIIINPDKDLLSVQDSGSKPKVSQQ